MLSFEEFISKVQKEIGRETTIKIVSKNNNVKLRGISMVRDGVYLEPVIYLDNYFEQYQLGSISLDEVVSDIRNIWDTLAIPDAVKQDIQNFDKMKGKILFKLVNTERNRAYLENVPHVEFLDLSVVFYVLMKQDDDGRMTAVIENEMMDVWKTDTKTLYELAKKNTIKVGGVEISSLQNLVELVIDPRISEEEKKMLLEHLEEDTVPLLVLTSKNGVHGAGLMVYTEILKQIATVFDDDLTILPSSLHEVLIAPGKLKCVADVENMKQMVHDINENVLQKEDVLSDNVYQYRREENRVVIV